MALWIFGDSFSVCRADVNNGSGYNHQLWHETLAVNLGFNVYNNYAQWGVSNEYIIDQFVSRNNSMNPGDYIVIQLTAAGRQWFFKDAPELANYYVNDLDKLLDKDKLNAVNQYIAHLQRDELDVMRYDLYLMALQHIASQCNWAKILIIPGFQGAPNINGCLLDVCNGEFTSADSTKEWYSKHKIDIRANHMSEENHNVLATKLTQFFKTGTPVDLTTNFKKEFL